jgi:hypothetical protein
VKKHPQHENRMKKIRLTKKPDHGYVIVSDSFALSYERCLKYIVEITGKEDNMDGSVIIYRSSEVLDEHTLFYLVNKKEHMKKKIKNCICAYEYEYMAML